MQSYSKITIQNLDQVYIDRFWKNADKQGFDDCWEWKGWRSHGYGGIRVKRKVYWAHIFSYVLHYGSTKGLCVLHECDNPPCVNPWHLFLGTQLDNIRDMVSKGRNKPNPFLKGGQNTNAKLKEHDAILIYNKYKTGDYRMVELALEFDISIAAVHAIISGRNWGYLTNAGVEAKVINK